MNLYKIEKLGSPGWDCYFGFVIAAFNEEQAREIAESMRAHDEPIGMWLNPLKSRCTDLQTTELRPGLILSDFKAG